MSQNPVRAGKTCARWSIGSASPTFPASIPSLMADELHACGLDLIEDFSAEELISRYDPAGAANGLKAEPFSRVARAVVE